MVKDFRAKTELTEVLRELLQNEQKQKELGENIQQLAKHQSAEKIAEEVIKLAQRT